MDPEEDPWAAALGIKYTKVCFQVAHVRPAASRGCAPRHLSSRRLLCPLLQLVPAPRAADTASRDMAHIFFACRCSAPLTGTSARATPLSSMRRHRSPQVPRRARPSPFTHALLAVLQQPKGPRAAPVRRVRVPHRLLTVQQELTPRHVLHHENVRTVSRMLEISNHSSAS